jgi:hypothetical protein
VRKRENPLRYFSLRKALRRQNNNISAQKNQKLSN